MKISKKKISALSGETQSVFTDTSETAHLVDPFKITASKFGIKIEGKSMYFSELSELEDLAQLISQAWEEYTALKPKIEIAKTLPNEMN